MPNRPIKQAWELWAICLIIAAYFLIMDPIVGAIILHALWLEKTD